MNLSCFQYHKLMILALIICLPACWPSNHTEKAIAKLMVINVLEKSEFDDCHITGSINIPFDQFEDVISSLDKHNHYVIYCSDTMCMSSGFCAKLLKNAQFEHVWAYEGGMAEWYQKGYPYEGPALADYLTAESEQDDHDEQDSDIAHLTADLLLSEMKKFGLIA